MSENIMAGLHLVEEEDLNIICIKKCYNIIVTFLE
jgi:hypothetical protein